MSISVADGQFAVALNPQPTARDGITNIVSPDATLAGTSTRLDAFVARSREAESVRTLLNYRGAPVTARRFAAASLEDSLDFHERCAALQDVMGAMALRYPEMRGTFTRISGDAQCLHTLQLEEDIIRTLESLCFDTARLREISLSLRNEGDARALTEIQAAFERELSRRTAHAEQSLVRITEDMARGNTFLLMHRAARGATLYVNGDAPDTFEPARIPRILDMPREGDYRRRDVKDGDAIYLTDAREYALMGGFEAYSVNHPQAMYEGQWRAPLINTDDIVPAEHTTSGFVWHAVELPPQGGYASICWPIETGVAPILVFAVDNEIMVRHHAMREYTFIPQGSAGILSPHSEFYLSALSQGWSSALFIKAL